ncbi:HAD family hydrolase [Hydrogenophaga sp. R2]|uniref:HAD family hydrolase n=1 Tax=Hydrogenophaga sp. R2 TaxID=3132827 RepID=UPI003CEDBFE1
MTGLADVQAVLFDLDGTLIDSAPDLGGAADEMRLRRGWASLPMDAYRPHAGSGARGMLRVAFDVTPEHADYEVLREEFYGAYEARLTRHTRPFDEVPALIDALERHGLAWGVVTNKAHRFADPLVAALPLLARAATVVCGDTTPHAKPHPEPLFEAARRLGLEPQRCIYVGDDERDMLAGRSAGMRTIAAGYGYLGPQATVEHWPADGHILSPLQLLKWLGLP